MKSGRFPLRTVLCLVFLVVFSAVVSAIAADEPLYERFAPVIMHSAASPGDYITNVDFDGDWIGNNNWENYDKYPKKAHVYYAVRETDTHVFAVYGLFHPRDYERDVSCPGSCHENDMESIQLVIRKPAHGNDARVEFMETIAHDNMFLYLGEGAANNKGNLKTKGKIVFTDGRPTVFVEQYGHGIYGGRNDSIEANPAVTKQVMYVLGEVAMEPSSVPQKGVTYKLVDIYDTLWAQRACVGDGRCFDTMIEYDGVPLPATFDGIDYSEDKANLPWGYYQAHGGGIKVGDWFFDPAKTMLAHAGPQKDFSVEYTNNRYLDDIIRENSGKDKK